MCGGGKHVETSVYAWDKCARRKHTHTVGQLGGGEGGGLGRSERQDAAEPGWWTSTKRKIVRNSKALKTLTASSSGHNCYALQPEVAS